MKNENNYGIWHPKIHKAIHKKGTMVLIFHGPIADQDKTNNTIPSAIHPVLVVQFICLIQWNKLRNFKLVLLVRVTKKAKVEKGGGGGAATGTKQKGRYLETYVLGSGPGAVWPTQWR